MRTLIIMTSYYLFSLIMLAFSHPLIWLILHCNSLCIFDSYCLFCFGFCSQNWHTKQTISLEELRTEVSVQIAMTILIAAGNPISDVLGYMTHWCKSSISQNSYYLLTCTSGRLTTAAPLHENNLERTPGYGQASGASCSLETQTKRTNKPLRNCVRAGRRKAGQRRRCRLAATAAAQADDGLNNHWNWA